MSHAALATRLPAVDRGVATQRTRLIASLDGAAADGGTLRVTLAPAAAPAAIRLASPAGDVEIVPLLADGSVAALLGDDGLPDAVHAMAALANLEPLVAAVEHIVGSSLRPVAVAAPLLPVRVRIDLYGPDAAMRHAAVVGIGTDAQFALAAGALTLSTAARLRVPFAFLAAGPSLVPARLVALAPGDLVLVGGGSLAGQLDAAGRRTPAMFRPADGRITITEPGSHRVTDSDDISGALDPGLRLPLAVRIDGGQCTLGDVAGLAPGSVLPLGIAGATLPVTLEVAGSPVAAGELVAVGDAYGVLITRRFGEAG